MLRIDTIDWQERLSYLNKEKGLRNLYPSPPPLSSPLSSSSLTSSPLHPTLFRTLLRSPDMSRMEGRRMRRCADPTILLTTPPQGSSPPQGAGAPGPAPRMAPDFPNYHHLHLTPLYRLHTYTTPYTFTPVESTYTSTLSIIPRPLTPYSPALTTVPYEHLFKSQSLEAMH